MPLAAELRLSHFFEIFRVRSKEEKDNDGEGAALLDLVLSLADGRSFNEPLLAIDLALRRGRRSESTLSSLGTKRMRVA